MIQKFVSAETSLLMNYFLPCFRNSNSQTDEREPLLPKHAAHRNLRPSDSSVVVERGTVDKIVDILVAFNAGKLPSQAQLSGFLQILLSSDLLRQDGKTTNVGPMSKDGQKVLNDVRNLVQSMLQFGLEKNDDDKLQEIYFQISQINPSLPVNVHQVGDETTTMVDVIKEGAAKLNDQAPSQDELAFDTATFLSALRALAETSLTSSVFRLILADLFAIVRDLVEHAAADAAFQAQHIAEGVEIKAREDDRFLMPDIGINEIIDAVKDQGRQAVDGIENATQAMKKKWKGVGDDVADKTKEKILERIKQVILRAQKDVASRAAMRAILVLAQKYADKFASGADVAASTISDVAEQASESISKIYSSSSQYPPNPYPPKFNLDSHAVTLLRNMKEILERLGKNHALDGLLAALKKVVCDLNAAPVEVVDRINKGVEDKTGFAGVDQVQPAKGRQSSDYSPVESKGSIPSIEANSGSPQRAYFARIGAYLDKGLDDPGWVMSKEGAEILEGLFDDGVELIGIVGDTAVEVGKDVISPEVDQKTPRMDDDDIRVQFRKDFKMLMEEVEAYVSAVENDKTTMQIFRALDTLGDDLSGLLQKGRYGFDGLGGWTHWIGWAIPRLMRILPRGAIPIPSVEIKTKNLEGGLYALFVQGLAGRRGDGEDSFRTKLIPDEVVLKEWTEVRIDMAERERPLAGPASKPGVQTTSRVHIHMDGVRAKVEGMSYYFKYFGGLFHYEDEGLLSVDVGMNSLHSGLGADIEVEIENSSVEFDSGDIMIEHEELIEDSGNRDIQEAVASSGSGARLGREIITNVDSPPEPLFHVVDVKVALSGVKFKIDKSRHWILNKLLQPLAGPVIARVVRQALEDKIRLGMNDLALGLGAVAKDAKQKGEVRRARERSRLVQEDPASGKGLVEEDVVEGPREFLTDWWSAILQKGPVVLGYDIQNGDKDGDGQGKVVETNTRTEATMKGIIHSSTTKTTEQPKETPVMVYNKANRSMEIVDYDIEGRGSSSHSEEETVVAIGGGAQLFPGKGGDHEDQQGLLEGVRESAKKAVNEVVEGLDEAGEAVGRIEDRWGKRKQVEKRSSETWKSDAFDFH